MLSMSDGFMELNSEAEMAAPSRMYSGAVPELMEFDPRMSMVAAALGSPEEDRTVRPGTCPWRA